MTRSKRKTTAAQHQKAQCNEAGEARPERSRDELLNDIMRKLRDVAGPPLTCRDTRCRRARRCVGATMRCLRDNPPTVTPEQGGAALAAFQDALRKRMKQTGAGQG